MAPGRAASRSFFRVVEDDQVDVAGIVQLARAVFAHAEHDVAALLLPARLGRRGRTCLAAWPPSAGSGSRRRAGRRRPRESAAVTWLTSQTPPRSASAVTRARRRLASRSSFIASSWRRHSAMAALRVARALAQIVQRFGVQAADQLRRVGVDQPGQIGRGAENPGDQRERGRAAASGTGLQQRRDAGGFLALRALQPQFAQGPLGHLRVVDEGGGPYGIGKRHERLLSVPADRISQHGGTTQTSPGSAHSCTGGLVEQWSRRCEQLNGRVSRRNVADWSAAPKFPDGGPG